MNRRRLGRGLEALLGREEGGFEASSLEGCELNRISVDQIDPNPFQPRRTFSSDEIAALADSIKQHGMLQPVLVRTVGDRFQLIAGERRLRASIEAHLHEIPARVMELDDQRVFEIAMVENLQREDLNAIDKATAFREYLSKYGGTQEELAGRLGIDRSTLSNLIRLLDLPQEVRAAVQTSEISQGHARAILGMHGSESQVVAYRRVVTDRLTVRQTEALVTSGVPTPSRTRIRKDPAHSSDPRTPHVISLEENLKRHWGELVSIKTKTADRGQIVFEYDSREQFDQISSRLLTGQPHAGSIAAVESH